MQTIRPQWPHTIDDIRNSLDGIWGLVGATNLNGNLMRLERSLHEPLVYTISEYEGNDEGKIVSKKTYNSDEKELAISSFAAAIGF